MIILDQDDHASFRTRRRGEEYTDNLGYCCHFYTVIIIIIIVFIIIAIIIMIIHDEDLQQSNAEADRAKKLQMEGELPSESKCDKSDESKYECYACYKSKCECEFDYGESIAKKNLFFFMTFEKFYELAHLCIQPV